MARWLMVIFVCAIAREPRTSTDEPPRKCRIETPRSKPARLTSMNFDAGPWNQVALIQPSSCQTVRKRSQSPASRQTAQSCTTWMIASRSASISARIVVIGAVDDVLEILLDARRRLCELLRGQRHLARTQ